jgi:hypothetical protein
MHYLGEQYQLEVNSRYEFRHFAGGDDYFCMTKPDIPAEDLTWFAEKAQEWFGITLEAFKWDNPSEIDFFSCHLVEVEHENNGDVSFVFIPNPERYLPKIGYALRDWGRRGPGWLAGVYKSCSEWIHLDPFIATYWEKIIPHLDLGKAFVEERYLKYKIKLGDLREYRLTPRAKSWLEDRYPCYEECRTELANLDIPKIPAMVGCSLRCFR